MIKNKKKIYASIFLSELGDFIFLSCIALYLLEQGFSAVKSSSFIAMMTLPNILAGVWLGNIVDKSMSKAKLYLGLSIGLALMELILLTITGWMFDFKFNSLTPIIFMVMACLYSPYLTLTTHYIVPLLEDDEEKAYTNTEFLSNLATFIGCLFAALILYKFDAGWLILVDATTFIVSGILIFFYFRSVKFNSKVVQLEIASTPDIVNVWDILKNKQLMSVILFIYTYTLLIIPIMENLSAFGFSSLKLESYVIGGFLGVTSFFELAGSLLYRKYKHLFLSNSIENNQLLLFTIFTTAVGILIYGNLGSNLSLIAISIAIISSFNPMWNINTKVRLRENIPANKYGQVFGLLRIPRSILTFVGVILCAKAITLQAVSIYLTGTIIFTWSIIGIALFKSKPASIKSEELLSYE